MLGAKAAVSKLEDENADIQAGINVVLRALEAPKVVHVALQDAASVAGLMITTEAMVAETPKKKAAPAMRGGGVGDRRRCRTLRSSSSKAWDARVEFSDFDRLKPQDK